MSERRPMRFAALCAAQFLLACGLSRAAGTGQTCDRACLHGLMDEYLAALVAHDPTRLATTPGVKFTENTNRMALGDGLWHTIDRLGSFRLYVEDPETRQAAFYGTVKENGVTALLGVRLQESGRRVDQIETFVIRQATGIHGEFDNLVRAEPIWEKSIPSPQRSSRQTMVRIANRYFEGIVQGNGAIVPFAEDFSRIENGLQTAGGPASAAHAESEAAQFSSKRFNYIHEITDRRFLLVDPERGLVYAVVMFQHPGNIKTDLFAPARRGTGAASGPGTGAGARTGANGGTIRPRGFSLASYPNTTQIIELFRIRGGKIQRIFAYVSLLPYRQRPGWSSGMSRKQESAASALRRGR
ncbi:MAG: hypothetical protein ACREUT_19740 [Steroidobacteraceae bacterium]